LHNEEPTDAVTHKIYIRLPVGAKLSGEQNPGSVALVILDDGGSP
jgi:hypothetical protein